MLPMLAIKDQPLIGYNVFMAIHLRGVISGQKIELESDPGLPVGSWVQVTIGGASRRRSDRRRALRELCGVWKGDSSIVAAFDSIAAHRLISDPRQAPIDVTS